MRTDNLRTIIAILFVLLYVAGQATIAEAQDDEKVIYKYKTYERIDLGNLEVKGEVIAPGDLSGKKRAIRNIRKNSFERTNFRDHFSREFNVVRN